MSRKPDISRVAAGFTHSPPASKLPGVQTLVDPVYDREPRDDESREPDSALPALPTESESGATKYSPSPRYRAPTDVKNKHRTKLEKGEEYGHPVKLDYNHPTRRHFQAGDDTNFLRLLEAFVEDVREMGVDFEADKTAKPYKPTSLTKRRHRQRGQQRLKRRQRYRRNKQKEKMRAKRRYRTIYKRNPRFKRRQKIRRKNPTRFRMRAPRAASVLTAPEIAFVIGTDLEVGYVHSVSPMTGMVTFAIGYGQEFRSLPARVFLSAVVFLSEEDIDAMFDLLDVEIGPEVYEDHTPESLRARADSMGIDCDSEDFKTQCYDIIGKSDLDGMDAVELDELDDMLVAGMLEGIDWERSRMDEDDDEDEEGEIEDDNLFYGEVDLPEDVTSYRRAATIDQIMAATSLDIDDRSEEYKPKLLRADPGRGIWSFQVGKYDVKVKGIKKGQTRRMNKAHVQVSCSCPYWRFYGPEYHAVKHSYLYGKPRGTVEEPTIRDPEGEHWACKHVVAALRMARNYRIAGDGVVLPGEIIVERAPDPRTGSVLRRYRGGQEE